LNTNIGSLFFGGVAIGSLKNMLYKDNNIPNTIKITIIQIQCIIQYTNGAK
jgi:hypothetical protein